MKKTALRKATPASSTGFVPEPTQPADWVRDEFGQADLTDQRHLRRLQMITTAFAQKPTAPIPQACPSWAEAKAAYRFLANDRVLAGAIRGAHQQATLQRVKAQSVVLAVQDTTMLNYSTHPQTRGLGPLGSHSPKTIGLLLHSTLAITPGGQPLGFLHNALRARRGVTVPRHQRKLADKESYKWVESLTACQALAPLCPETQLVNIADREGDLYDLFAEALSVPAEAKVHLLVRARHDRPLAGPLSRTLWQEVGRQPVAATFSVLVGRRGDQPSRLAKLNVCFCRVELKAPLRQTNGPAMPLWAVEARESTPVPKGGARILWRLLTTLPVDRPEQAVEKVRWYAQRWQIEVLHKVLKSGCQIEQRQLETAQRLERVLSVDLVVAWRILALCKAARELPDDPVSHWLPQAQWRALCCYVHRQTTPPEKAPSVREAIRWIAQLGGFLARKNDGPPGTKTLWRGLQQLNTMTEMWQLFQQQERRLRCG